MTYRSFAGSCVFVVGLAWAGSAVDRVEMAQRAGGADKDVVAITGLIERYAQSVDAADTRLASEIWATAGDVSFIHPLGHERGWESIRTNVYTKLMGETFSERKLDVRDIAVHAYRDTAWAEFYWDFVAKLRSDGKTLMTHGRESQVYRKIDGRWRLVHVHYSGMPATGARQGL
jgi:ketosteroid isomerase-like protein